MSGDEVIAAVLLILGIVSIVYGRDAVLRRGE